jgi:DNA-binding response OmpR family regulator
MKTKFVVVVEDDPAMREIVAHKLITNGFEIKQAEDGKKGLDMIISEKPSLVLLDLMLPEMDGFQVLEAIRKSQDQMLASLPVIILSNLWSNQDILRAKTLFVQAYLVKAYFTPDQILAKVNEVLGLTPG